MFKKIVSSLPFSPALFDQIGFYAKRLKGEETTRRLGLIFVSFALIAQSLAVFQPPESANASNDADFILGGVKTISVLLDAYDNNTRNFRDIMSYVGITRSDLQNTTYQSFKVDSRLTWGLTPHYSYQQGERELKVYNSDKQYVRSVYYRPLKLGTGCTDCTRQGWVGKSKIGWFAIKGDCGNLITEKDFTISPILTIIHTCDIIKVTNLSRTSNRFTVNYTLKNATLKNVTYTIRNSSGTVIDTKTSTTNSLDYTNNTVGKYTVQATINSVANGTNSSDTSVGCTASFEVTAEPTVHTCNALKVTNLSRTSNRFTVNYTLKNATLKNVTYTIRNSSGTVIDTKTSTTNSLDYTNNTVGKYTVQATINSVANGTNSSDTSVGCTASFEVTAEPTVPIHTCNSISIKNISRTVNRFTVDYTTKNAIFKDITFTIKDSKNDVIDNKTSTSNIFDYTNTIVGKYSVQATINSIANGTNVSDTSGECISNFEVTAEPEPEPDPEPEYCVYNPNILADDTNCKPCPGNETIWINDISCIPNIVKSKSAINISQGSVDAVSVVAKSQDQISYTITIENTGLNSTSSIKFDENLSDVLEYSSIIDNGGGIFDESTKTLSWPDVTLQPKAKQMRTFIVKMSDEIPATAQGSSNDTSYDCLLTNTFGNSINIIADCPIQKDIEHIVTELPVTGPNENLLFAGIVLAISTYFYARSRQQSKEIRLVRRDVSAGLI